MNQGQTCLAFIIENVGSGLAPSAEIGVLLGQSVLSLTAPPSPLALIQTRASTSSMGRLRH